MSKLGLLNLLMFLVLLTLGAAIYFAPENTEPNQHPLSSLQPQQINHILLQRKNQDDVHLEKRNGQWMLNYHQRKLPAHQWRVEQLLGLLKAKSEHRFQSDEWEKFGLAPPRAKIQFNDQTLLIGDNDPIQRQRYVASGNDIMLVADRYYIHLFADINDYLSLAPFEQVQIKDIQYADRPTLRGDAKQTWLDNWQYLQALQVKAAKDIQHGKPITAILQEGSKLNLLLQDNILVRPDLKLSYELSDISLKQLFPKP